MERTNRRQEDEFHQSGIEIECVKGYKNTGFLAKGVRKDQLNDALELINDEFKPRKILCITGSKPWLVNVYYR